MEKQELYNWYNATSTEYPVGSDELETYESWLERQLLSRIERLEALEQVNGDNAKKSSCNIPLVSVSFSAEGMQKVDKYHKQTLSKVNKLYKYLYDRSVCATELADQQEEVFAYLQLTDDIKEAYKKFRDTVCGLVNER